MENIWSEIRSEFEDEGVLFIDAWVSPDDDEEGKVIATVNLETGVVSYRDERAKTDKYAQEVISLALQNITGLKDVSGKPIRINDKLDPESGAVLKGLEDDFRKSIYTIPEESGKDDCICTEGLHIPDQGIPEESNAPENFSMCELEDFIDEHGKFLDEIQVVTGYDLDSYFYEPGSTKWIPMTSPDYSERDQAISNYLQAHKHFPTTL